MVAIIYSLKDTVSMSAAKALIEMAGLKESKPINGLKHFSNEKVKLLEIQEHHLHADFLDQLNEDCLIILSRHTSAKEVPSFTVHSEGNWSDEAKLGGKPKELAVAAPDMMLRIMKRMKLHSGDIGVTYEATHHGPFLKTPSLYAEIGGNDHAKSSQKLAEVLARSVLEALDTEAEYDKVAFGIGGLHYADRFAKRAMEGKFAFGHIMSKHNVKHFYMIQQGIERCAPTAEIAVIDWDTMSGADRQPILKKLEELGIDYVKI